MRIYIYILFLLISGNILSQNIVVSGYVKERLSEELLGSINIANSLNNTTVQTNNYGFYSIILPKSDTGINLFFTYNGLIPKIIRISGNKDTAIDLFMDVSSNTATVTVRGRKTTVADKVEMGKITIPIQQIKEIPALLGEKDVLKVIQLLPGVQKGGEGQSGIYVRGGGPDQNLIILDEAPVYNVSHLFGFFSLFNGDALRSVELSKGGFPARFGGRLSSVLELTMKEGNRNKYSGEVGVGLVSSRAVFEGPIKKNKGSFIVSGRRTYIDILAQPLILAASGGQSGGYFFYDFNAKANYDISAKDKIYISGYLGRDKFYARISEDGFKNNVSFGWGNYTLTGRWNHQWNRKTFSNTTAIVSHYDLTIKDEVKNAGDPVFSLNYSSKIDDLGLKHDIDFRPWPNHTMRAGINSTLHTFRPSALVLKVAQFNEEFSSKIKTIYSIENGIYLEDKIKYGKLNIYPGIRISNYKVLEKLAKNYFNFEPRISTSYQIKKDLSVKASYAKMNQYIHLLSSSGIGLPTDLWIPATDKLKPESSGIVAAGVAKDLPNDFSLTIEGYYKEMKNVLQYKDGATFFVFDDPNSANGESKNWENQVYQGKGTSYGSEVFLQKQYGKLSGWIGYTLSWTTLQFDKLNEGKPFYARYDRRHDASVVAIYRMNEEMTLSATWVYGTGNAVNLPRGVAAAPQITGQPIVDWALNYGGAYDFEGRNSWRMEAYHRLDVGLQMKKKKKNGIRTWEISLYNAYNRKNPFFYISRITQNNAYLRRVSIFPIIPSVSWTYKFNEFNKLFKK